MAPATPRHQASCCLVSPLTAFEGEQRPMGRERNRQAIELALPGIGARYLGGVARHAAACGWTLAELAALVIELESRCTYWVAASTLERLGVPGPRRISLTRSRAWYWSHRGWVGSQVDASAIEGLAGVAQTRRAILICAASGSRPPRAISLRLEQLERSGTVVGRVRAGLAAALGAAWAIEALTTPGLTTSQLAALREQFASAPRCGWCGLPVVGSHCRRCTPGAA